ncbi:MAG: hypothetical protein MJ191_04310 [Clostridium sp.]|nr:hypothetical protein [Clostridium sp.]
MDKINNIIKIIEKELKVNREIIKEAIRKNDLNKYGDYSILCYIFKNHFKESPLIIAKKIADILKANGIKICEVVGPYVNIYIEENIVDAFFSHLNIKEKSIN